MDRPSSSNGGSRPTSAFAMRALGFGTSGRPGSSALQRAEARKAFLHKVAEEADHVTSPTGSSATTAPSGLSLATNDSVQHIDVEGREDIEGESAPNDAASRDEQQDHSAFSQASLTVIVDEGASEAGMDSHHAHDQEAGAESSTPFMGLEPFSRQSSKEQATPARGAETAAGTTARTGSGRSHSTSGGKKGHEKASLSPAARTSSIRRANPEGGAGTLLPSSRLQRSGSSVKKTVNIVGGIAPPDGGEEARLNRK